MFVKMHRNSRRNATETVVYDQVTTSVQNNWRQLLVAGSQLRDLVIDKTQVQIEKKKDK